MATRSSQPSPVTLTSATRVGRRVVKYGTIALVVMIVGRMLLSAAIGFWRAINPPPPPPPTVGFGILPKLTFPDQTEDERPTSYQLETGLGSRLPELKVDRAKVFLMPKTAPNLLADQEAKQLAAAYGFIFQPELLSSRKYRWTKSGSLNASLEMDTQTNVFTFETNYLSKPELITNSNQLPEEFEAVRRAKSFLDRADLLPADVATSAGEVVFLKSLGSELEEAFSLSDADFLQINLDRWPVDDQFEAYSPDPTKGTATAILTGVLSGVDSVVHFEFHHRPIDYTEVETYPLRSAKSAWQVLQSGDGYVAAKGLSDEAVVREMTLGYYEDWFNEQEYYQPIYVFSGDNGFVGYVPAIDPSYIQQEAE